MTSSEISDERLEQMLAYTPTYDEDRETRVWYRDLRLALAELRDRRAAGGEAVACACVRDIPNPLCAHCGGTGLHPSNSGVTVKALEWEDHTEGPGCPIRRIARTGTCVVWIFQAGEAEHWYLSYNTGLNGKFLVKGDETAARAAAQTDYERRILSALHPSPNTGKSQDQEGTWSDGGKEWTLDEVSFKAGWDKAKQMLNPEDLEGRKFTMGDRVSKVKGASWTGLVVGFYSTSLTPVGYAIESENEPGSVQIYPESALKGDQDGE